MSKVNANFSVERDVMVPMRDGIRLRTDIFLPLEPGPFPVLLCRLPYQIVESLEELLTNAVSQGYAVVFQHSRGRFGSEGTFYPLHCEIWDGYDAVEWAAVQSWSNGKVGMFGASYGGLTQWLAAIARPPHLVAIAPVSSSWSAFNSNFVYWQPGVIGQGFMLNWTAYMIPEQARRAGNTALDPAIAAIERVTAEMSASHDKATFDKAAIEQAELLRELLSRRPLRDIKEFAELAPWWKDWCDHDDPADPYWQRVNASEHVDALTVPIQHVAGWGDFFAGSGIDAFSVMAKHGADDDVRRSQRLLVGPWNHGAVISRPDLSPESIDDLYLMHEIQSGSPVMEFFRHHLKGERFGLLEQPPVRIFVMGENRWRDEWEWPLARTNWTDFFLHSDGNAQTSDGTLSLIKPMVEEADSFAYDPREPVPGPVAFGLGAGDDVDPRNTGLRSDVLAFATTPLDADLEVTGPVSLELWASSSVVDTDFTASLLDVFPDGTVVPICQGVVRASNSSNESMQPGSVIRCEIDMWATSNVFKVGHRIRLHISSSEFPTYELNPNTGQRITHDSTGQTVIAQQTVYHQEGRASRLILPVIPRGGDSW